ncbi:hypothetical protein jhhlp_002836, partial [Lomentospora prolificans]
FSVYITLLLHPTTTTAQPRGHILTHTTLSSPYAMATSRERRIAKELSDIRADRDKSGVFAEPIDGDLTRLKGTFPAPPDTVYAGGTYQVDIQIPDSYPFKPPIIKFDTKIFHPNISSQTGAICLDILGTGWSPVQTIKSALISLRMLLEFPNPKDPQDAEVAKMSLEYPEQFARTAHEWAVKYAGAPRQDIDYSKFRKGDGKPKQSTIEYVPFQIAALSPSPRRLGTCMHRADGYSKDLVDRFVNMGFPAQDVVDAFVYVGIDRNGGEDYELEEAYMGDITARLLGES